MRSTLRVLALVLVLLALLVPLTTFADGPCGGGPCFAPPVYADGTCGGGPCPDDPVLSQSCDTEAPPFYVVINRSFEDLTRPGTGCQPIILKNPDCTACCDDGEACGVADNQLAQEVCPMLADKVTWTSDTQTEIVYEMCCNSAGNPDTWQYRVRLLHQDGTCPVDPQNEGCYEGLPPGTGVDLPAPVIVGGLAVVGVGLLSVGMVLRRRTVRLA